MSSLDMSRSRCFPTHTRNRPKGHSCICYLPLHFSFSLSLNIHALFRPSATTLAPFSHTHDCPVGHSCSFSSYSSYQFKVQRQPTLPSPVLLADLFHHIPSSQIPFFIVRRTGYFQSSDSSCFSFPSSSSLSRPSVLHSYIQSLYFLFLSPYFFPGFPFSLLLK